MKKIYAGIILAAVTVLSLFAAPSQAREVIKNYDVSIEIKEDRSMIVTERITASVEHVDINKGIIRSFPVVYRDSKGRKVTAGFKVLGAEIDGEPTDVSVSSRGSYYKDARIGDQDKILSRGDHTFTITYKTTRQLGSFEDYDELYWNVTGNDWIFPILSVSCSVKLPGRNPGEGFDTIEWYSGKYGQKGKTSDAMALPDGTVKTTRPLTLGEGFTVVYTWPKGIIAAPPTDNFAGQISAGITTLALILAWFTYARRKYSGADDKAVIPLFNPPNGASPAFTRYIYTQSTDNTSFTAAIIGLAVKGALKIKESKGKGFPGKSNAITLIKESETPRDLEAEEQSLMNDLFKSGRDSLELKQSNAAHLLGAQANLRRNLKTFTPKLIDRNTSAMLPAMAIYALGAAAFYLFSPVSRTPAIVASLVGGVIILIGMLRKKTLKSTIEKTLPGSLIKRILSALLGAALAIGLFVAPVNIYFWPVVLLFAGISLLTKNYDALWSMSTVAVATAIAAPIISGTLPHFILLPIAAAVIAFMRPSVMAYTEQGAELTRGVEGLLLYMDVAEKDRLQMLNPPEETPRLFERLLPYALALGIEKTWGNRFEKVLQNAQYVPTWYTGPSAHIFMNSGGLNSFSNNLSRQVSNSMHVPSSSGSSGSSRSGGGGGFSGGGRGGGGGRGW